jgi:antitoxin (DNA-binding transcriptional repressor) of toxin-antitoxin stability system
VKSRVVSATEFKAKCLGLFEDVARSDTITITKGDRPVAQVSPVRKRRKSPEGCLAGKVDIPDDLLMSDISDLWDCVRAAEARK